MYGMVNNAVRGLVIERYGDSGWATVHTQAGAPANFAPMEPYGDEITYALVGSIVKSFNADAAVLLHELGVYWIDKIATVHYAEMLSATGTTFVGFVKNLDHMHARIRVNFPSYQPPSFRVLVLPDQRLQVDYYSDRPGLTPFVEGLFAALARHFKQRLVIEPVADDTHGMPCKRLLMTVEPLSL